MKRFILLIMLLALSLFFLSSAAITSSKGTLITDVEAGSAEESLLKAFYSPFSEEWIEQYAEDDTLLKKSYTSYLASILPLKNILLFKKDGFYVIFSQESKDEVVLLLKDNKISELYFLESGNQ